MMRILMTVSSTSLMDGINRHVLAIAPALNALPNVEVGVVTLHPWGELNGALNNAGVKCWSLDCTNGHQLKVIPRFCRLMREYKPDVVHGHVLAYWESVMLRLLFRHVRTVGTTHGIGDPIEHVTFRMRVEGILKKFGLRKMDVNVFISRGVKERCVYEGFDGTVVYNPISFESNYESYKGKKPISPSKRVIGTACRFAAQKNLESMVRVVVGVVERCSDVEAWLIGDGPLEDLNARLHAIADQSSASGRIKFLGYKTDVLSLMSQMDCFIMTSHWEGLPTSLLEAMSVGTPIAFMIGEGGLQDLAEINRKDGPFAVMVKLGDERTMVNKVCELLNDQVKAEAYAKRALEIGRLFFDLPVVARQLKEIYEACLRS